jgi:uncharacterized protein YndB with AHSA1/START domain
MKKGAARAIADVSEGTILATVDIAVPPERVFRALSTAEDLVRWWGADDVYRTTNWTADFRVGGRWRAEGRSADGKPFAVEGEFVEIDPPRKLVQTWKPDWAGGHETTLTYRLETIADGTRLTLRHEGFRGHPDSCSGHASGWEKVLTWLVQDLVPVADERYYACRLIPPRPTFAQDFSPEEGALMRDHAAYWTRHLQEGRVVVFGPVADPKGAWGLGVVRAADDAAMRAFEAGDPVMQSGRGFRYESSPMRRAVVEG